MEITKQQIEQLLIKGADRLDPIRVIMEPFQAEYHSGHFTVLVYGRAWTTFWGNMGSPMRKFVLTANTSYIVDRLARSAEPTSEHKRERDEQYLTRIVEAIKAALRQEGGAA